MSYKIMVIPSDMPDDDSEVMKKFEALNEALDDGYKVIFTSEARLLQKSWNAGAYRVPHTLLYLHKKTEIAKDRSFAEQGICLPTMIEFSKSTV